MKPVWIITAGLGVIVFTLLLTLRLRNRNTVPAKAFAEWMNQFGVLLKHQVPVTVALVGCADGAPVILEAFSYRLRKSVTEGETLSVLLAQEFVLPQSVIAVLAAGEIYGTLPEAFVDAGGMLRSCGKRRIKKQETRFRHKGESAEQQRIYEVAASMTGGSDLSTNPAEEEAPLIRIAHSILAQAIKSGAAFIEFEPVRTQKPPRSDEYQDEEEWRLMDMEIGPQLLVTFGRELDRWEAMRVPKYIIAPLYRRLKVMAEVPYWQKPPVSGRIAVRHGIQDYDIYLDSMAHPLGEKIRLEIREAE